VRASPRVQRCGDGLRWLREIGAHLRGSQLGIVTLSCEILLDTTASMTASLPKVKSASYQLIDDFRQSDSLAIYGFTAGLETHPHEAMN